MDPDDRSHLAALSDALRKVQSDLSLEQVIALLTIASMPGLSVNELAERTGAPQQSASRYASVLMGRYSDGKAGDTRPFITQSVKQDDPRSRALFLAGRGQEVVKSFIEAFRVQDEVPHGGR